VSIDGFELFATQHLANKVGGTNSFDRFRFTDEEIEAYAIQQFSLLFAIA
jgi:hypothetical protein